MTPPDKEIKASHEKIAESAEKLKQSSKTVERSTLRVEDSADRRTELAGDRTVLAAERTYAAWVRTGLLALASGIGARAVLKGLVPEALILANATVLIAFSVFCFGSAVWRQLVPGDNLLAPDTPHMPRAVLIIVNAFLALVSLAAIAGIWMSR